MQEMYDCCTSMPDCFETRVDSGCHTLQVCQYAHFVLQGINLFCPLSEQILLTQAVFLVPRQPVLHLLVLLPLLLQHLHLCVLRLHGMPHVIQLSHMLGYCLQQ